MALTGNIEVFPLPEVLRLLARSGKNGCLRIDAGGVDGRIYIEQGAISLATVTTDAELIEQFASSGVVDADRIGGRDPVSLPDALVPGRGPDELADLVREHNVESLYRIRKPGRGMFEFLVDSESRYRTGQALDAEQLVAEADRRAADWSDVEQTIADMHLPVRMVPQLRDPEVTVNAPTWRVLAALEGGASVTDIARHLGTTQFRAAREVASLIRASLVEPVRPAAPAWGESVESQPVTPVEHTEPEQQPEPEPQPEPQAPESWFTPAPEPVADESPAASPWANTGPTEAPWAAPTDTPDDESESAASADRGGWWAEAMGAAESEVDTDQFLESVFSEAESDVAEEEESGFSMGLLRRRRMGPVTKDITEGH